jgi:glycosyltransferase involved in cell wall biosynthesis
MAVFNGARYLRQAVESVLNQTLSDLEFVIVDDASTDETAEILSSYGDPRIILLNNGHNIGLTRSLNCAIHASSGKLIARQDADDLSLPDRLEKQVAYMHSHPIVGLVGSASRWIDAQGSVIRESRPPTEPARLQELILSSVPFLHGTFMFRRECLADLGGYNEQMPVAQDCDLFLRLSERWEVANLPDILYVHRRHEDTVTARRFDDQKRYLRLAQQAAVRRRLAYGRARLGIPVDGGVPNWVGSMSRRWWSQRYAWWSAAARRLSKHLALQFLIIGFLLDPITPELWSYVSGILARKAFGWRHKDRTHSERNG